MADAPKTEKVTLTNVSGGPKVVNAVPIITLHHGESADVEMTEGELAVAKGHDWFEFGKAAASKAAKGDDTAA